MRGTLTALDLTVVLVYLAVVVGKGGLLAKKQRDLEDYFLAGRKMGFFAVGISIIASLLSAITYLGAPAEAYGHDLRFSLTLLCIPLVTPIVLRVFLPFFYQLNLYTAYEYLERRFNLAVRTVASVFFMFWRLCWMALVIYAPSLALSEFVDIPWWAAVLILGVLSTAYTTLGGMRAVIWTDVVQFFVLYGGVLLVGGLTLVRSGVELGAMWAEALAAGKLQVLDFRLDPTIRVTTPAIFLGWTFGALAAYATDQVAIQRYLTTKNFAESRRSLIFHALVIVPVSIVFYWVGSLLWAFYHHRPELLSGFDESRPDRILPFFIVQQLPLGLKGILIAALFAATMSSIDSGINSVTTATIVDFYQGLLRRRSTSGQQLALARVWTVLWGGIATWLAIAAGVWGQTLVEMSNKTAGLFMGPLLGIFLLGMLTRRATGGGALLGATVGFALVLYVAFRTPLTFLYYPAIGCLTTLALGYELSLLFPPPRREQILGLTLNYDRWGNRLRKRRPRPSPTA